MICFCLRLGKVLTIPHLQCLSQWSPSLWNLFNHVWAHRGKVWEASLKQYIGKKKTPLYKVTLGLTVNLTQTYLHVSLHKNTAGIGATTWVSQAQGQPLGNSLARWTRQEIWQDELILLYCKIAVNRIFQVWKYLSVPHSRSSLQPKKLGKVSSEPLALLVFLLRAKLPLIWSSSWVCLFTIFPKLVPVYHDTGLPFAANSLADAFS